MILNNEMGSTMDPEGVVTESSRRKTKEKAISRLPFSSNEPSGRLDATVCEVCKNEYDKLFTITFHGKTHTFDCFECAVHRLAPSCQHCGCRILGHGIESEGMFFCCANCSRREGMTGAKDRVEQSALQTSAGI